MNNGREELARRLNRIFIAPAEQDPDSPGAHVDPAKLQQFADEILEADYYDPRWGPRRGDGGPAMALVRLEPDA